MEVQALEDQAEQNASRVLALIQSGQREGVHEFINGLDRSQLAWVVLSLANGLLFQESENGSLHLRVGVLTQQNETYDVANQKLFAERRKLSERVDELRGILYQRDQKRAA